MSAQHKYQSSTTLSWLEVQDKLQTLAAKIMTQRYVAFVTAADLQSNIPAHFLANLLSAEYHPNAIGLPPANNHSLVFALDNHAIKGAVPVIQSNAYKPAGTDFIEGYATFWRYSYLDQAYNMLMTPQFYLEDIEVEVDARVKIIKYPWNL
jgi:hypothetical protein